MKKIVHCAVYDTMSDWEAGYAIGHINSPQFQKEPGSFQVKSVGLSLTPITTRGGMTIQPDLSIDDLDSQGSHMLLLPGADTAFEGGIDPFVEVATQFLAAGVPVAAICGATAALAKAGLLDAVPHTSNAKAFLEMVGYKGGAHYQEEPAVTAGNLITASGVAPVEFAIEIFRKLGLYTDTTLKAWYKLYKEQKAEGFFELMAEHS